MQGREIHDQDKINERIEEFYIELYDSDQSTIIYTHPKVVPEITSLEVGAALRVIKNGIATCNDHINTETVKVGKDTISKTQLYTKCLSERGIPTAWKNANNASRREIRKTSRIADKLLLSNIYKMHTKIRMKRLEKTLAENQARVQTGFKSRYQTTDHTHVVNQLEEKCREYKYATLDRICRLRESKLKQY